VLILCVVHAAIRREAIPAVNASDMTAGELIAAVQMAREVEASRRTKPSEVSPAEAKPDGEPAVDPVDENVRALSSVRQPK
jgi:hypothetical protein